MKPQFPQPPLNLVRQTRSDAVLTGVGATLLIFSLLALGLLLVLASRGYGLLLQLHGSGVAQFHTLTFLVQMGGALFFGALVVAVVFALLLSRTPRPGLALFIEGLAFALFVTILVSGLASEAQQAIAGSLRALGAAAQTPLQPM